jgi:predicted enzyme related to lactoylglutathione lyase
MNNMLPGNIVWFEIPADDTGRVRKFYSELFGWKFDQMPGPMDYWHADTGGPDASPDGGVMKRQNPGQRGITNYVLVLSRGGRESAEAGRPGLHAQNRRAQHGLLCHLPGY